MEEFSGYHSAATWETKKKPRFYSSYSITESWWPLAVTHLYHVDDVVRQPEEAEHDHDGQDELLAADPPLELGLPDASEDEDVAGYDDGVRKDESWHRLQGVLEAYLRREGKKKSW